MKGRDFVEGLKGLAMVAFVAGCAKRLRRPRGAPARPPRPPKPSGPAVLGVAEKGRTIRQKVRAAVEAIGGVGKFIRPGSRVLLKPNAAFSQPPEVGANTHPEVVVAVAELCHEAGAKEVLIVEHTIDRPPIVFKVNGMEEAALRAGIRLIAANNRGMYRKVEVPEGRRIKSDEVVKHVFEVDVIVNLPVCKDHNAAGVSLGLKNLMGLNWDRGRFHALGLHQCIVDLATVIRPHLTILDATRCMLTGGPRGPGKVVEKGVVVAGEDPVAVDAFGCRLLLRRPEEVGHVRIAHEMGLGEMNLEKVKIKRV
ncbi:MAG TPA: DUF362 domain-containing protein [Armatimonadetes bacterium]|nr:DUF362 domain-containing protein [Armatimonadota bacterium]